MSEKLKKAVPKIVDKTKEKKQLLTTDYNIRPGDTPAYRGLYNTEISSPEKREYPA